MIATKALHLRKTAGLFFSMLLSGVLFANCQETSVSPKTAVQQFRNIQVLKDITADQLVPTMQFISGSLGVDCEFCHVENAMDKDDKEEKRTARKMMTMQLALNRNHFHNEVEVTCYSCHRGSPRPVGTPMLSAETSRVLIPDRKANVQFGNLPTVDEILDHYLTAVGGADALHKISTRIQKGTIDAMGEQYSVEVYSEAPEKRVSISHPSFGESVTAYNGQTGWLANPRGVHPMSAMETQAARVDAQIYFPARIRELYLDCKLASVPVEFIAGRPALAVLAQGSALPTLRLYFDQQTGLLVRMIRYAETPLGRNPTQIDYSDYRDTNGTKIPYQWMLTRTNGTFTIRIASVQQNVPVDEKLFVMPPLPTPAPQR